MRFARDLVDIEHGDRRAGDLLGAAERIAVELAEQGRGIERGRDRDRQRGAARAGHEIGEHGAVERQALVRRERPDTAPCQRLGRRPHVERIDAFELVVVGPADIDRHRALPGIMGADRHPHLAALLFGKRQRPRLVAVDRNGAFRRHRDLVVAGGALDVVEHELHGALVAGAQEARQRRRQHHRIAHDDVAGRMTDLVLAPAHRHHAHGAGEGRNGERHMRDAVIADLDDAGIERERRLHRRRTAEFAGADIAASADRANHALHAVDQLPVKVADLGGEPALAEIIAVGRRRLVVGEVEDADVDGGHHHAHVIAGLEAGHPNRHVEGRLRAQHRRQIHAHGECVRRRGRCRTTARRWRGQACAWPARRAGGAR